MEIVTPCAIVVAPLLSFLFASCVTTYQPKHVRKLIIACLSLIIIEILACIFHFNFISGSANLATLLLGIAAYCCLMFASWCTANEPIRKLAGFILIVQIGCTVIFSPIVFLIGSTVTDDIADSGRYTVTLNSNYECRTKDAHGMLATTYPVSLYQHWRFLPFVEHQLARKWGDLANVKDSPSCDDVVREYLQTHPEMASDLNSDEAR